MPEQFDHKHHFTEEGFSADQNCLEWICPKCKHHHPSRNYDLYEGMDATASIVNKTVWCDECGTEYELEIYGESHWTGYDFFFKETK